MRQQNVRKCYHIPAPALKWMVFIAKTTRSNVLLICSKSAKEHIFELKDFRLLECGFAAATAATAPTAFTEASVRVITHLWHFVGKYWETKLRYLFNKILIMRLCRQPFTCLVLSSIFLVNGSFWCISFSTRRRLKMNKEEEDEGEAAEMLQKANEHGEPKKTCRCCGDHYIHTFCNVSAKFHSPHGCLSNDKMYRSVKDPSSLSPVRCLCFHRYTFVCLCVRCIARKLKAHDSTETTTSHRESSDQNE